MRRFLYLLAAAGLAVALMGGCRSRESAGVPEGTLLVIDNRPAPDHGVTAINLDTREETVIFTAPEFSQIHEISAGTSGSGVYLAYTPPPSVTSGFLDRSAVFFFEPDAAGEAPQPLVVGQISQEYLLEVSVTADGRYLYFVRYSPQISGGVTIFEPVIIRFDLIKNQEFEIATGGSWPAAAPAGDKVTYVHIEPGSGQRGLVTAAVDGSFQETLLPAGRFFDLDRPLYTPDGAWVYFAVAQPAGTSHWWERLMRISVAEAHADLPATWWRIPAAGGTAEQVTQEPLLIYGASFSPNGRYLAASTSQGIVIYSTVSGLEVLRFKRTAGDDIVWLNHFN